jgi:protein-disulfide isomerase
LKGELVSQDDKVELLASELTDKVRKQLFFRSGLPPELKLSLAGSIRDSSALQKTVLKLLAAPELKTLLPKSRLSLLQSVPNYAECRQIALELLGVPELKDSWDKASPNFCYSAKEAIEKFEPIGAHQELLLRILGSSITNTDWWKRCEERRGIIEQYQKSPLIPRVMPERATLGNPDGRIQIFAFEDFGCPFARRGSNILRELLAVFKDEICLRVRHLPLSFHPKADTAARVFEVLLMMRPSLAQQFRELMFAGKGSMGITKSKLQRVLSKLNVQVDDIMKQSNTPGIHAIVDSDIQEAEELGFVGTPGYVVNGCPLKGAYPKEYFLDIINAS